MTYASIAELREAITVHKDPAYAAKMLHAVPELPVVAERGRYLVEKARGKRVVDIGCGGPISEAVKEVAAAYHGVDKVEGGEVRIDLDASPQMLPQFVDAELVLVCEFLEHLANPGRFLEELRFSYHCDFIFTVPNAGAYAVHHGTHENVNGDHVAWYSYTTLKTLLTRYGFEITAARWYNGQPHTAEGLIVMAR